MNVDIEELKRLAEAATMGPWKVDKWLGARSNDWIVAYDAGDKGRGLAVVNSIYSLSDAKYIAAANPAAILELIRQRDELLAALDQERKRLDWALGRMACYEQRTNMLYWLPRGINSSQHRAHFVDDPRIVIDELIASAASAKVDG